MEELKPCPFCGGEADLTHYEIDGYLALCTKCDAMIENWFEAKEAAIEAWNRRAYEKDSTRKT